MCLRNACRIYNLLGPYQAPIHIQYYSRWSHRKPSRILLPFEKTTKPSLKKEKVITLNPKDFKHSSALPSANVKADIQNKELNTQNTTYTEHMKANKQAFNNQIESNDLQKQEVTIQNELNTQDIIAKKQEILKKKKFYLSQTKVFDDNNEIIYEKLKDNDTRITTLLVKLKSKKERQKSGQVLVEGWRMIVDGLEAKCKLNYIIFSRIDDLLHIKPHLPKTGVKIYKIPYKEINMWSDVDTSPGIFGIFNTPNKDDIKRLARPLPLQIICDNIRVPGNLGAILRIAVGVGCDKLLLTKGCVDVWDPKVVRSGAGAHFRLPLHYSVDWEDMSSHLEEDTSVFIADSNAKFLDDNNDDLFDGKLPALKIPVIPYYSVDYTTLNKITLVIGGETEGISDDSYRLAASHNGVRLNIPLQRGVDSLNTGMAAAVIAFEIRKQLSQTRNREAIEAV